MTKESFNAAMDNFIETDLPYLFGDWLKVVSICKVDVNGYREAHVKCEYNNFMGVVKFCADDDENIAIDLAEKCYAKPTSESVCKVFMFDFHYKLENVLGLVRDKEKVGGVDRYTLSATALRERRQIISEIKEILED